MYKLKLNFKPMIRRLDISSKKDISGGRFAGSYVSSLKGKGLEFYGFRKYTLADDASKIDWKASLRANKLLIKQFTEERAVSIVFALDVSSSMSYSSIPKLKNEYAAELLSSLAFASLKSGDGIGLLMFTDEVKKFLPPKLGKRQYYIILKALSNPRNYDGNFDFSKAMVLLSSTLRKGSVVVLISDFIGLKPDWQKNLDILSKKFDVVGIMIRDPLDNELPGKVGPIVISDPYSDEEILFDPEKIRDKYAKLTEAEREYIKSEFMKRKCSFFELETTQHFESKIPLFFKKRFALRG